MPALSISAWIRPRSGGESIRGRIVDKAGGTAPTNGWSFNLTGDGTSLSFAVDFATAALKRHSVPGVVAFGAWQHVAVTWDGGTAASGVRLYVDGVEVAYAMSTNAAGARAVDAAQDLRIGNDKWSLRTFDGLIDDVRIWQRPLPASEVANLVR
jgi:Concanavalin A-like lectin/glucanases superfamily